VAAALVTGAASGLGSEIARALSQRGVTVHVTDVDGSDAERAATELGGDAFASALDVRDAEACRAAARKTAERAGSLDVWVNNAGVLFTGHVWDQPAGEWTLMLEVNTVGTVNGTLAALELMRPAGRGHVINIISLAGLGAPPGEAFYAATKHAALGFSLGTLADLRRDAIRDVHVSCVCPDGIWTPMISDKLDDPDAAPSFSGTLLDPADVAAKTLTLLDRPRAVLTIPRWRGWVVRAFATFPNAAQRAVPLFMKDARRKQQRWKQRIERGERPGG
jgi:NAD(P)-dependent dehydrogenase (short-subunit alcohol dehydrogenase family)